MQRSRVSNYIYTFPERPTRCAFKTKPDYTRVPALPSQIYNLLTRVRLAYDCFDRSYLIRVVTYFKRVTYNCKPITTVRCFYFYIVVPLARERYFRDEAWFFCLTASKTKYEKSDREYDVNVAAKPNEIKSYVIGCIPFLYAAVDLIKFYEAPANCRLKIKPNGRTSLLRSVVS